MSLWIDRLLHRVSSIHCEWWLSSVDFESKVVLDIHILFHIHLSIASPFIQRDCRQSISKRTIQVKLTLKEREVKSIPFEWFKCCWLSFQKSFEWDSWTMILCRKTTSQQFQSLKLIQRELDPKNELLISFLKSWELSRV